MSLEWVRQYYDVPAKRGAKVKYFICGKWQHGRILSATNTLKVKLDDVGNVWIHPTDEFLRYE